MRSCVIRRCMGWLVCAALIGVISGCGGGKNGNGASLKSEYRGALKISDPETRAEKLIRIASRFKSEQSNDDAANECMIAAEKACGDVEKPIPRAKVFASLASGWVKLNVSRSANAAAKESAKAAEQIESPSRQARALCRLAKVYSKLGKRKKSSIAINLKRAEGLVEKAKGVGAKMEILVIVARTHRSLGNKTDAGRLLDTALAEAAAISDATGQADAYIKLAAARNAGKTKSDRAAAAKTLALAEASAKAIELASARANVLADIAEQYSNARNRTKAHALLDDALKVADGIRDAGIKKETHAHIKRLQRTLPRPKGG